MIKVNAFTIYELLIVLCLSSIIIKLSYDVIIIVSHHLNLIKQKTEHNLDLQSFINSMNKAVIYSNAISHQKQSLGFDFKDENILYAFTEDQIIRMSYSQNDTFDVSGYLNINNCSHSSKCTKICAFEINIHRPAHPLKLDFRKEYSSVQMQIRNESE